MSKSRKSVHPHALANASAQVMGGGVGLAALESMFNLVQGQSVINAAMVRDHELNHPLMLEALAVALNEVLGTCRSCHCGAGRGRAIGVDFPKSNGPTGPLGAAPNDDGNPDPGGGNPGGVSDTDKLVQEFLKKFNAAPANGNGNGGSSTTTTTTSETVHSSAEVEELVETLFTVFRDMMGDVMKNSRSSLMVT